MRQPHAALEALLSDQRLGAVVIGPGLGHEGFARSLLDHALESDRALVIDGDALTSRAIVKRRAPTILTPHSGEFVRLFGATTGSKMARTRAAAERSGATVIFKGADTVIASPEGRLTLAPAGCPWLSTAGTGDVLAGLAGAMLARGLAPHEAACAAVWLHGEAAWRAGRGFVADDLLEQLDALL